MLSFCCFWKKKEKRKSKNIKAIWIFAVIERFIRVVPPRLYKPRRITIFTVSDTVAESIQVVSFFLSIYLRSKALIDDWFLSLFFVWGAFQVRVYAVKVFWPCRGWLVYGRSAVPSGRNICCSYSGLSVLSNPDSAPFYLSAAVNRT